jgi:adenylate cyclase
MLAASLVVAGVLRGREGAEFMSNAHAVLPMKVMDRAAVVEPRVPSRAVKRADRAERARVLEELDRIVASGDFDASRRSRELLRFVVEETLAGRGAALTQTVIAVRVFDRRGDFDALVDPIVRIQAGRLRRSLERYYLLSGVDDPLRIEVPRGTYVPVFRSLAEKEPASVARSYEPARSVTPAPDWPTVAVSRFEPAPGLEQEASSARLSEMLGLELGRYADVRALLQSELDLHDRSRGDQARFSLGGRVREEDGDLRVTARLIDRATGAQVWGDEYHTVARSGRWSGPLDDIARVIAARVGSEEGVIVQLFAGEHRKLRPVPITPYSAILLSYKFSLARDANSLAAAILALQRVGEEEPECGLAWTELARLFLANHAFEVTATRTPIDEAVTYAQRGVRVDPASRRARAVLAAALLVKSELTAARRELEEALRLSPDSLVYLEVVGSLLALLGEDERGAALIRSARERNPHCLPYGSLGLWVDHIRRGEVQAAYEEALEFRDAAYFWRAVMRACCLARLGRAAEAESEVAEILRGKHDFAARGRVLIGHFIKRPEVMGEVVDGLAKAGLKLA